MSFAKVLLAWAISMPIFVIVIHSWRLVNAQENSGFLETLLGVGVLLLIPSLLFAIIVGWPAAHSLSGLRPAWLSPPVTGALLAFLMWVSTRLLLPNGWVGVEYTLVAYAASLGLVIGCINLASGRAG